MLLQSVLAVLDTIMSSDEAQDSTDNVLPAFFLQSVLDNVFKQKDLLDFGQGELPCCAFDLTTIDTDGTVEVQQQPLNIFSLVSGSAAAANKRAQAIAGAKVAEEAESSDNVVLRCVEGYGA